MKNNKQYKKAVMLAREPVSLLTNDEARDRVGVLAAALLYKDARLNSAAIALGKLNKQCSIVLDIDKKDVENIWPFTSRPHIEVLSSGSIRVTRPSERFGIRAVILGVIIVIFTSLLLLNPL